MNFYELYLKPGFGRRIRRVNSVGGMKRIGGNLWTAIDGYGHDVSPSIYEVAATGVGTATVVFTLPPIGIPTEMTLGVEGSFTGAPGSDDVYWTGLVAAPKSVAEIIAGLQADASFPAGVTLAEVPGGISATVATGVITELLVGWIVMLP